MTIYAGTANTRAAHSEALSTLNLVVAVGIPAAVTLGGIVGFGIAAIDWTGAIIWGLVAAFAMWIVLALARATGMTTLDLPDLLGSMATRPRTDAAKTLGVVALLAIGALLGIAYAYGLLMAATTGSWLTGMLWGAIMWALTLLLLSSIGAAHPAIRRGAAPDPGPAGTHYGLATPVGLLLAYVVYGVVLGALYRAVPLT